MIWLMFLVRRLTRRSADPTRFLRLAAPVSGSVVSRPRLLSNPSGLDIGRRGDLDPTMTGGTFGQPCSAHNCLRPQVKEGWCIAHWYAHEALLLLHSESDDEPDSLAICRAIWAVS